MHHVRSVLDMKAHGEELVDQGKHAVLGRNVETGAAIVRWRSRAAALTGRRQERSKNPGMCTC